MQIKYDTYTKEWFRKHPFSQTTVEKCDKCGLFYKQILGHKCRKGE